MRRTEREVKDREFMLQVLRDAGELYIAFNTGEAPYVIAVNHVLHEGCLYFHCATEGRKLELLGRDNRIGFMAAVDIEVYKTTTRYRSVSGTGHTELVTDDATKEHVLKAIATRFNAPCTFPVSAPKMAITCIVRVHMDTLSAKHSHADEGKRPMAHYEK